MKILLFLLIPVLCFGQMEGSFYLTKKQVFVNNATIKYLTNNLNRIVSIGGQVKYKIPYEKEFLPKTKTTFVNDFLCQYEVTYLGMNKDITIFKPKTKYIEFDFKKKTIIKDKDFTLNDNADITKPIDLKEKLQKKEKLIKGIKP